MTNPDTKVLYDFKKQIKALKGFRGRGTELISVYITPGYSVSDVVAKLRDEFGQAANIKSKSTQKNVQAALERAMHYLKQLGHKPPENGIAIFAGNISETEGKSDVALYSIIPPFPLQTQFYRCDSTFVTGPLEDMFEQTGNYGLVVMDGRDAAVAILKGKIMKVLKHVHSTAHGKFTKGGQSANRFARIHEEEVEVYHKRVGEAMDLFVGQKNFKGVILGGPGPTKETFLRLHMFNHQLKVLGVVDTGYSDEFGLRELLEKSDGIISEQESIVERKVLENFMREIATGGLATYGLSEIRAAIASNKIAKLLVSEDLVLHELSLQCPSCKHAEDRIVQGENDMDRLAKELKCPECGANMNVAGKVDVVSQLTEQAMDKGVEVILVSRDTHEGEQFHATFAGLGAFLRYK